MRIRALWRRASALVIALGALAVAPAASQAQPALLDNLSDYSTQRMLIEQGPDETLAVRLDLGGEPIDLTLSPHSVRSERFEVLAPDAEGELRPIAAPPPSTYRGEIEGAPEARVAASVLDGRVEAMIELDGVQWAVEPLDLHQPGAAPDLHLVYRGSDLIEPEGFCGVDDMVGAAGDVHAHASAGGQNGMVVCEVAVDSDVEYYQRRGSSSASVISSIEQVINSASAIYERDVEVTFEVATIVVRDAFFSPYSSTHAQTLLEDFAQEWQRSFGGQRRDVAHLFSGKNLQGGTLGIAFLRGVCSTGVGYGVDQMAGISLIGRIGLFSHELGHNFNAKHCSGGDCRIMCPGLGGCTGDISRFGAGSRSAIVGYAATRSCLEEEATAVALPFQDEFPSTTMDEEKWPEASGVQVSFATSPPSAPYGMSMRTEGAARTTKMILDPPTTGDDQVWISLWTLHRSTPAGRGIAVEYFSTTVGDWKQLDLIFSDGDDQPYFRQYEWKAPFDAYGDEFQLRIRSAGLDSTNLWFVDDVEVNTTCRADVTGDGELDFFDFLAFQNLFASEAPQGDFTGDGALDFFDFLEFQDRFSTGCN